MSVALTANGQGLPSGVELEAPKPNRSKQAAVMHSSTLYNHQPHLRQTHCCRLFNSDLKMIETKEFQKVRKQFALNNSYFKNTPYTAPQNPNEVLDYYEQHKELPFNMGTDISYWMYECYVEYQKRRGVYRSQFFTPPATADRLAELADEYFETKEPYVLDACCGFGMLSEALQKKGFIVKGFDTDYLFKPMYNYFVGSDFDTIDFREYQFGQYQNIVSNPPYEVKECAEFLEHLHSWLTENGRAVLLLPKGFIDKDKPKSLVQTLSKFSIIHREDMSESFARTNVRAEIVVLGRK